MHVRLIVLEPICQHTVARHPVIVHCPVDGTAHYRRRIAGLFKTQLKAVAGGTLRQIPHRTITIGDGIRELNTGKLRSIARPQPVARPVSRLPPDVQHSRE